MNSIRFKLILVVSIITVFAFITVLVATLQIVKSSNKVALDTSNNQVSELVSQSVLNQVNRYRNELGFLHAAWNEEQSLRIQESYFQDYLWIQFLDWEGTPAFEWANNSKLSEYKVTPSRLLGKLNSAQLFSEVRSVLSRSDEWLLFNSTVEAFMPTFLYAFSVSSSEGGQPDFVILAEIYAEPLYRQIKARKDQELVLIDSHLNELLSTKPGWDPSGIVYKDKKVLEKIKSIKTGESQSFDISYPHRENQMTWIYKFKDGHGLSLVLQEPTSNLTKGMDQVQKMSALAGLIVLIFVINLIFFFASRLTSPLKKLLGSMEKVGKGEFGERIKVSGKDEFARLAKGYNRMLSELGNREEEIDRAKSKLIQSEKMSAFGQMSAGIAHEVKNPLAGILGYAQIAKKKLEDKPEIQAHLEIIEKETTRCKEIVENLMRFARQEKATLQKIDGNKTIRDSVRLVEHQITVSGIKINQIYANDGAPIYVMGSSNQIQQVMLNLMLNGQHAMGNKGELTVTTHYDEKHKQMLVVISDTGEGMPPEVKARIFEPFFTTKGVGKGTGLGLSVSIGIIKDHKGTIECESTVGKGTTFTITLPTLEASSEDSAKEDGSNEETAEAQSAEKKVEGA